MQARELTQQGNLTGRVKVSGASDGTEDHLSHLVENHVLVARTKRKPHGRHNVGSSRDAYQHALTCSVDKLRSRCAKQLEEHVVSGPRGVSAKSYANTCRPETVGNLPPHLRVFCCAAPAGQGNHGLACCVAHAYRAVNLAEECRL